MSYQRPASSKGNNFLVILLLIAIAVIVAFAIAITTSKTDPSAIVNSEIAEHPAYSTDSIPTSDSSSTNNTAEPLDNHTPPVIEEKPVTDSKTEPVTESAPKENTVIEDDKPIPEQAPSTPKVETTKPAVATTESPKPSPSSSKSILHQIQSGENLSLIARKYNLSIGKLKEANGLSNDIVQAGKSLTIPITATHKVASGETLSSIAEKYQVKAELIKKTNKLKSDAVQLDSELIIPLP